MNILIIGNADSVFIKNYIQYILLDKHHSITILSTQNSTFSEFYVQCHVKICLIPHNGHFLLGLLRSCITAMRYLYKENFDVIHAHFVSVDALVLNKLLKKKSTKCIASFWGSDLFRAPKNTIRLNRIFLRYVDIVTISTSTMREVFQKDYGNSFNGPIQNVKFGNPEFKLIQQLKKVDKNEIKKELDIPSDRVVFAIGYNRIIEQQHLKVLEQIALMPVDLQRQIHLILRLTYGNCPDDYLNRIKKTLERLACSCTMFESFLTEEQIAQLETVTDVFIHAQITDAFSATVQEHVYAGALLMNPQWIRYQEMRDAGVYYLEYENFNQLREYMINYITDKEEYHAKTKDNASKIYAISSWDAVSANWYNLY